ncbi:hypothetical protein CPC16_005926 [Podila verticillata]|nr:hypothetical protein BGZ59_009691 [Podila verticillata]KAF9389256.1 hypothetical protein CPC16_005926 [Podila verticillata]KFH73616.1 hypothetical protein MVEG_00831 [Podila verticillata NRRL 6337]
MVDHNELIAQFVSISGATAEQAQFYLEANNWDINTATSNFYEEPDTTTSARESSAAVHDTDDEEDEDLDDIVARTGSTSDGKRKADSSSGGRKQGGIATLRDFAKEDSEDEEDSDQEPQNYFAGGEKSGVMVQGPPGKKDPNALVEDILKKAAKGGLAPEEAPQPQPKKSYFTGSGNRLGSEGETSSSSAPVQAPQTPTRSTPTPEALETVTRHLTFWRNGYSLDDGPLMSYTDPANREFLDAINRGQAPIKYLNIKPGQPVEMRVAKRMDEDYKEPPKAPPKAFEGTGNRLGSVASPVSGSSTPGSFPSQSTSSAPVPAPRSLQVDESQPVTSIQIRLADGSRMVARFNHTHTVNDIRGYINASQAGESSRAYVLQTSFPKKDLEDLHQTVKDAGLLNAVVLQRYL